MIYFFLTRFLNFILGIVIFFLGFRILFRFFYINPNVPFVNFINRVSDFLISPFYGLFPNIILVNNWVLDLTALAAIAAYTFFIYLVLGSIESLIKRTKKLPEHRHVAGKWY